MWIFLVLGIVLIIALVIPSNKDVKNNTKNIMLSDKKASIDNFEVYYKGGFPDISIKYDNCIIRFPKDKIVMDFIFDKIETRLIPNADIISVEYTTNEYITQQIGLGKLVVFGFLALGMKNTKKITEEYIMLKVMHDNKELAIILDCNRLGSSNERVLQRIQKQIRGY